MLATSEFTQEFFESSSKAWKANKVRYGQAMYKYKKNAFVEDNEMPPLKQSLASKRQTEKELTKRATLEEPAPLRERRSPRLHKIHIQETYTQ